MENFEEWFGTLAQGDEFSGIDMDSARLGYMAGLEEATPRWQPYSTVEYPDGLETIILLRADNNFIIAAYWNSGDELWWTMDSLGYSKDLGFTHWMKIPE